MLTSFLWPADQLGSTGQLRAAGCSLSAVSRQRHMPLLSRSTRAELPVGPCTSRVSPVLCGSPWSLPCRENQEAVRKAELSSQLAVGACSSRRWPE